LPLFHTDGLLLRDADRDADTRISSVEQVIAVINVVDIYVVVVVPAISPFARPWIHKADPIPAVLKPWVSANGHGGKATDAKSMLRSEVSAVPALGDAIPVVAAALLPAAVIGLPVFCTVLLPGAVPIALPRLVAIVAATIAAVGVLLLALPILGVSRLPLLLRPRSLCLPCLLLLPVFLPLRLTALIVGPGLLVRMTIPLLLVGLLPLSISRRLLPIILHPTLILLTGVLPSMVLLVGRPVLPGQGRSDGAEKQ